MLADVLAQMGKADSPWASPGISVLASSAKAEASVLEAQVALKMLADQPDLRKAPVGARARGGGRGFVPAGDFLQGLEALPGGGGVVGEGDRA